MFAYLELQFLTFECLARKGTLLTARDEYNIIMSFTLFLYGIFSLLETEAALDELDDTQHGW